MHREGRHYKVVRRKKSVVVRQIILSVITVLIAIVDIVGVGLLIWFVCELFF